MRGEPIPDEPIVPIRTFLRPSTYRVFAQHGQKHGLTVAEILSKLADASLKPRTPEPQQKPRRKTVPLTAAQQAFIANPDDPRHGTLNGYSNLKCRCDGCSFAAKAYNAGRAS